jgi:hypothetical protein
MDIPVGMEKWYTKYTELVVAKLKKCMYGTKHAARYYCNKVVSVMKEMKCDQSMADPCLFFKWDTNWGLANSWSVSGRTRQVDVQMFFLRELKEEGLVVYKHIPEADIFTKNVDAGTLHGHSIKLCSDDGLLNLLKGNKP